MKLTKIFSRKAKQQKKFTKDDFDCDATVASTDSIDESPQKTKARSENEELVEQFLEAMNHCCTADEYLSFFASPATPICFEDNSTLTAEAMAAEMTRVFASFPDFRLTYSAVKEYKAGTVAVEQVVASGTDSGAPFGVGPFAPIVAANKRVVLQEQMMFLTVEDGKIAKNKILSLGKLTGPEGFYQAIGGKMTVVGSHYRRSVE